MVNEKVICAAIWFNDGKKHEHQPKNIEQGFVVCGRRHHNCYITLSIIKREDFAKSEFGKNVQGFITDTDRFVNRKEAGELAFIAKQISEETNCLFSEDLY